MALSAFKSHNIRVLRGVIRANWQQETAYFANKLVSAITPLMYVLSFILFVSVLYQNIDSVAGYAKDEMLFLLFIGQLSFYSYSFWGSGSAEHMEHNVNNGGFDYILTKPVSSLFFTTIQDTKVLRLFINFLGPLTPSWLVINWSNLDLAMANLLPGLIILLCGVALFHQFQFICSMISFWTGRGQQATLIVYAASSQNIPLEGFTAKQRVLFLGIIPVFTSSVVASVMLGKSNAVFWCLGLLLVSVFFSFLKRYIWSKALRRYSSASS